MRKLVILRGAPGVGKSTWIKKNNLELYTLCPDEIRLLCGSPSLSTNGELLIEQNYKIEATAWTVLFELLEHRMARGEFTIIDATASKTKDIKKYKDIADRYRYKAYCVDFSSIPLETCLAQNRARLPEYKRVPEAAIRNIYARFETQKVPGGIEVVKPEDFTTILEPSDFPKVDLSNYNKIVFIGDIHGCYDTLMQYNDFSAGLKDDTSYIFCGDYLDRGNQNDLVAKWLLTIMDKPNVCLLEGNHERYLRDYGAEIPIRSKEFVDNTEPQLIAGGFTAKQARMLYRKCRQFSYFKYKTLNVLACHGGIPTIEAKYGYLDFIASKEFIDGTGNYEQSSEVAEAWMRTTKDNIFQVHGHRNISACETQEADRLFNLEGGVERGGALRIVELDANLNWTCIELPDCQPINRQLDTSDRPVDTVEDTITYLRNNKYIKEKILTPEISSFNFTREAFYSSNWNKQTILARGLFLDVVNNKIMARSYEKFFKIGEVAKTNLNVLLDSLKFPITAYVKENGFLGIVSYNYLDDTLFVASKSTNQGDFAGYIREQLAPYYNNLLDYLREQYLSGNPVSAIFECEDPDRDPHIIAYSKPRLVLLDLVKNSLTFETLERDQDNYYNKLIYIGKLIGCPVKEKACVLNNRSEFLQFYNEITSDDYLYSNRHVEGFVFTDSSGFMVKCKTYYYDLWKKLRGVADQTLRLGYYTKTGYLTTALENNFYSFCKECYKDLNKDTKEYPYKTDIITLREMFKTKLKLAKN